MVKRETLLLACVLGGIATKAHAQVDNAGVLDQALTQYRTAAESWQNAAQGAATTLFWSLAAISLAWTMGQLVLRRAEIGEFFAELIRYLLFTGFWAWMLANGPVHAQLIMDSMVQLASTASAQNRLTPSGILDVGFHILDRTLTQSTLSSPLTSTVGIVVALGILIVLALAAVNMLVSLIACWIVAYGGLIILGFGGSRWTSDMAINYYRMVLSLGLQVLAMILLVGMGESFLRSYFKLLKQDVSLHELAVLLVVSLVLLVTVNRIPPLLGTLANGSSPQFAIGGGAGAAAAMSTMSAAAGLAAWSQGTGQTVAAGAGKLALGAGSLARAIATGTGGGTSVAMASLLDGFRSGGTDRSTSNGGGGGSVFPAPASASSNTAVAPRTGSAPRAIDSLRHADGGAAEARTFALKAAQNAEPPAKAADNTASPAPVASGRDADAKPPSGERDGHSTQRSLDPDAEPVTSDALSSEAVAASGPGAQKADGPTPSANEQGTRNPSRSSSTTSGENAGLSAAPPEHPTANSNRRVADAAAAPPLSPNAPTDNLAHTPSVASPASTAATATTASPTPSSTPTSAAPQATAPTVAIAASMRAPASPHHVPFSMAGSNEPMKAPQPATPAAATELSDRAELPAAYSQQTSVDLEAEVAAFRDKD